MRLRLTSRRRAGAPAAILAIAAAALLSACSDPGDGSGSGGNGPDNTIAAPSRPTVPDNLSDETGVYADRVVFGQSAALGGAAAELGLGMQLGILAAFEEANRAGGVNGRQLDLVSLDDKYEPEAAIANTRALIEEQEVFALIGAVGTPTSRSATPVAAAAEVPYVAPFTGAGFLRNDDWTNIINLRASYAQETAGLVENFIQVGRRRIGVFYQADAYGRSGWAGVRAALARHGERIVGEATYRRGTQFTATMRGQVELLQAAEPEAVICIGAYAACAAFARDAVDLGLRVPIANLSFVGSESMLGLLSEGRDAEDAERYTSLLVNSQVVPSYHDTSMPAVREYRGLMERYNPDMPAELVTESYAPFDFSFVSLEGFLDAKIMVEILRRLGDEPSRGDLERAVMTLRDYEIGISERVTFAEDRRQGLQQVYYTVVDDGRFVTLNDWQGKFS